MNPFGGCSIIYHSVDKLMINLQHNKTPITIKLTVVYLTLLFLGAFAIERFLSVHF